MANSETSQLVSVDGHTIKLTNLDKALYPATRTTQADVLAYNAAVAPVLLPHLVDRPATRKRWVDGVGTADSPGSVFFHTDPGRRAGLDPSRHHPARLPRQPVPPLNGVGPAAWAEVARWIREVLAEIGMEPVPVTSGSKDASPP